MAAQHGIRWGFVGTGVIADNMATVLGMAPSATLAAVASRTMASGSDFARRHGIGLVFDDWAELVACDAVDAVYVATPTSAREAICIGAANHGRHVLAEKPFASLASLRRIIAACRGNSVAFMDATHFVHHPRTADIKATMATRVGWPWSIDSAFQFYLADRNNIRFDPELEPLGAIGDAGWYNMRAAVEYLAPDIELRDANAYLRRDEVSGAVIGGSGILTFDDDATATWNCGFDSGAMISDLRISGERGSIGVSDFLGQDPDGSATYTWQHRGRDPGDAVESVRIASSLPGAARMFEDFARLVLDPALREPSIRATERTQALLDAAWNSALHNERAAG